MFMNQLPAWGQAFGLFGNAMSDPMPGRAYFPAFRMMGGSEMPTDDDTMSKYPPRVWPYIHPQAIADQLTQILYGLAVQKHLASLCADQRVGTQLVRSADAAEDFICGTVPHLPFPRPHNGQEWVDTLAWQLTANNLSVLSAQFAESSIKSDLEKLSTTIGTQLKHTEKQLQNA